MTPMGLRRGNDPQISQMTQMGIAGSPARGYLRTLAGLEATEERQLDKPQEDHLRHRCNLRFLPHLRIVFLT
jgi:hypothetical protein